MKSELHIKPIQQEAWHLQIKDEIFTSKRLIDKMSTEEILKMYQNKQFLCDTCGKELGKSEFTLEDHIAHMINPMIIWSCEDCIIKYMKQHNIIGTTEHNLKQWQIENI